MNKNSKSESNNEIIQSNILKKKDKLSLKEFDIKKIKVEEKEVLKEDKSKSEIKNKTCFLYLKKYKKIKYDLKSFNEFNDKDSFNIKTILLNNSKINSQILKIHFV